MATRSTHMDDQPNPDSQPQQSEAAAMAQNTRFAKQQALLQKAGLDTPDLAQDEAPPPTYGDIYGEIRNEKDGLGTSARVTDDGRVNIHINQLNRRFSQIFAPALRQQIRDIQNEPPPPFPYIPDTLKDKDGILPPSLNVVVHVVGSRGDVQPFIALSKVLKDTYGHRVRLATHPNFKRFVEDNGLEYFNIGGDPSRLMAFMVKNPSLVPGARTLLNGDIGQRRKDVAEYIQGCWRSCYEAGDGTDSLDSTNNDDLDLETQPRPFVADCIIANPPSFAHIHCAEKLGIPLHIMFTMPYSPTQAFPHPLANIQATNADPQLTNYLSYVMIDVLSWQGLGDIINRFRAKCLDLDPVSLIWGPGVLQRLKIPHSYCWSPALIPKPKDWAPHISITGFSFLDAASDYTPPADLKQFLDAGPPPVYIGFGSIVLQDPGAMTRLVLEAIGKSGQRCLLSKGWGGIGGDSLQLPDAVYTIDDVPHDWLFQQVSCVVHHGGAGTTSAGIAAGRPTIIVPFFGDQPFWGAMVARAGAGPDPIPHKQLTADKLADAIKFCLKRETLDCAQELARKIAAEEGSDTAAQSFHQFLDVDRLRCTLAPSRSAVWRIRRTQVRLSAFAACTLANANLLDFQDLKLFRPREYQTDEGPWDPISGGAAACYRAFIGMTMGVVEIPTETWKAMRIPTRHRRRQSQHSVTAYDQALESPDLQRVSTVATASSQYGQTSLNVQATTTKSRSRPALSTTSSSASNSKSDSTTGVLQNRSIQSQDNGSQRRVLNRSQSSLSKNQDRLRQSGAHSSKGMGRFLKSSFSAPVDVTMGLTKGFHNFPKMWGDDTVRPQHQVSGFKSGAVAAGKEFGFGMYDGFAGLVTQPWRGAQKEGTAGFFKGMGKGLGGFATKPFAGFSGLMGHTMKGVQKEIEKLFGGNVQNYIAASRVAQGYEEWQQSSAAEKQAVIDQWKLIQKDLKKKDITDEAVQEYLAQQHRTNLENVSSRHSGDQDSNATRSIEAIRGIEDSDGLMLVTSHSMPPGQTPHESHLYDAMHQSAHELSEAEIAANIWSNIGHYDVVRSLQHRQDEAAFQISEQEDMYSAMTASQVEAQRHKNEALEYQEQMRQAIAQSLSYNGSGVSNTEGGTDGASVVGSGSAGAHGGSSRNPGHLEGTTQEDFESQLHGEKTTQERTEEEIVMAYVKKQSLLEAHHRGKGKSPASTRVEEDDEEGFRRAIRLSMQSHGHGMDNAGSGGGNTSQ